MDFEILGYGKKLKAKVSWKIRRVGKDLFSDPLDILREGINNSRDADASLVEIEYDGKNLLLRDNSAAGLDINAFKRYGDSMKYGIGVTGRYGQGFKDAALKNAGSIFITTVLEGEGLRHYLIRETRDLAIDVQEVESKRVLARGTEFILPLNEDVRFALRRNGTELEGADAIRRVVQEHCRMGIYRKTFAVLLNGSEVGSGVSGKDVEIDFGQGLRAQGVYLDNESFPIGVLCYARGLYLDTLPFHMKGTLFLDMSFILDIPGMITPRKEIWWGHRKWRMVIEPALAEWVKNHGLQADEDDKTLKFLTKYLRFLMIEPGPRDPNRPKRAQIRSGKYAGRKHYPRHRGPEVKFIDDPARPFVDVTPETILVNRKHNLWDRYMRLKEREKRIFLMALATRTLPALLDKKEQLFSSLEPRRKDWKVSDEKLSVALGKMLRVAEKPGLGL